MLLNELYPEVSVGPDRLVQDYNHKEQPVNTPARCNELPDRTRRGSNRDKARRIAILAKVKAREADSNPSEDTPHQYNLGGHMSTWLSTR